MVMRGNMVKNRKERLSHTISMGAQLYFNIHHEYVPNRQVLKSSEVNEGQLFDLNLLRNIFFVMLLPSACIRYAACLYSSDFEFFNFWGR